MNAPVSSATPILGKKRRREAVHGESNDVFAPVKKFAQGLLSPTRTELQQSSTNDCVGHGLLPSAILVPDDGPDAQARDHELGMIAEPEVQNLGNSLAPSGAKTSANSEHGASRQQQVPENTQQDQLECYPLTDKRKVSPDDASPGRKKTKL